MFDNKRNSGSGIFVIILMIVFFSLFQKEKDQDNSAVAAIISDTNSSVLQAVAGPVISVPPADFSRINPFISNFISPGYGLPCSARGSDNLHNGYPCISQLNHPLNQPFIPLFFLQKIPEQGGDDDLPVLS